MHLSWPGLHQRVKRTQQEYRALYSALEFSLSRGFQRHILICYQEARICKAALEAAFDDEEAELSKLLGEAAALGVPEQVGP
jgi:hypothetical protein